MSETALTREIKDKLNLWKPKKLGPLEVAYYRKQYADEEVCVTHGCTTSGIIDYVWLAEGFTNPIKTTNCSAKWYIKNASMNCSNDSPCHYSNDELKHIDKCDCEDSCAYKRLGVEKEDSKAVVCFEIKVTTQDFSSKHGHNFVGNLNYYIVPKELVQKIKSKVPENIGLISYTGSQFRIIKDAVWNDISEDLYSWFLLSLFNKFTKKSNSKINSLHDVISSLYSVVDRITQELFVEKRKHSEQPECFKLSSSEYGKINLMCVNECKNDNCKSCAFSYSSQCDYVKEYTSKIQEYSDIMKVEI